MSEAEFKPPEEWAVVRPGEILVLRYGRDLTPAQADAIRERLNKWLPGVKAAIVGADEMTVQLPGEASRRILSKDVQPQYEDDTSAG